MAMVSYKDQSSKMTPATILKMVGVVVLIVAIFVAGLKVNDYLEAREMKVANAIFMVVWGVGWVSLFFAGSNWVVEQLPAHVTALIQPYLFVGPAVLILLWALAIPTLRTIFYSFRTADGLNWIGFGASAAKGVLPFFENYRYAFTNTQMLIVFRNNLLWLIFGTFFSVFLGLLIATLADRTTHEKFFKTIIFMPMAISFVGAGVIFKFIYDYKGQGAQIGLLNAVIESLGGTPQAWLQMPFWNNFGLIIIMIWLQTGYCMVILSSAIKGISGDLLEAARIDGANEFQIFFQIIIPVISGAIVAVTTTVAIFSLKTFDIVRSMTGGQYGTNVIANEFFNQRFLYYDKGRASAIAVVLLILVIPVMIMNLRQFNERKAF